MAIAKPSFLEATVSAVGRLSAISRAKLGPESTTSRSARWGGSTSSSTWLVSLPVPTSIPLEHDTISAFGSTKRPAFSQTSRTPWLGTTDSTSSFEVSASSRSGVARMLSGSRNSVR